MHQTLHSSCLRALLCGDEEPTLTEQKTRSMAEGHNEEAAGPSKKASISISTNGRATEYFAAVKERTLLYAGLVTSISMYLRDVRKHLATTKHQQLVIA